MIGYAMGNKIMAHLSPGRYILVSILFMIIGGTLALSLPIARHTTIPLIDLFFTATSATCVTGLFTIPLESFTLFGKSIILILIQIGGLGLITMTIFLFSLFVDLGMGTQLMAGQLLELTSWKQVKKILIFIFLITIITEIIGAIGIGIILAQDFSFGSTCFLSLFHAISSFCNAGISLLSGTFQMYETNYIILFITTLLMFIGGLGFITWYEIMRYLMSAGQKKRYRFSLHSKIILYGSTTLLVTSAIIFWILERDNFLANMNLSEIIGSTIFHVVSFRSTGFLLTSIGNMQLATFVLIMILGFIGSSPGSTGSGVKITTFVVFVITIKAVLFGKTTVEIRGRRIPIDQVYKAIAIVALSYFWILLTTFCLLITEQQFQFIDIVFETMSAFTTLGISTGITAHLSIVGKLFIILSMLIGRIGSVSFILALRFKKTPEKREFLYPEERVMLG